MGRDFEVMAKNTEVEIDNLYYKCPLSPSHTPIFLTAMVGKKKRENLRLKIMGLCIIFVYQKMGGQANNHPAHPAPTPAQLLQKTHSR